MPKISVVSIAKDEKDLESLKNALTKQKYQDFEFIFSTKGTIPEAWNDAISRVKGEFIVFTESDAIPLNENWLVDIYDNLDENSIIKGIEITSTNLNMCNLVGSSKIIKSLKFDENFPVAEDTEFFARARKNNIPVITVNKFPVIHTPSISWKKTISRAFIYGLLSMKLVYLYSSEKIDNISTKSQKKQNIHPISNRIRIIVDNLLFLLGLFLGAIRYLPLLLKKKLCSDKDE